MLSPEIVRQEMPHVEVFVQTLDLNLQPASRTLADDVRGDLAETRHAIVEAFGAADLPPFYPGIVDCIQDYYRDHKWTVPKSVLIDPARDALELRAILQEAKFQSEGDQEFFTGANDQPISAGGLTQNDIVIFHDLSPRYRSDITTRVHGWGNTITAEELEYVTQQKLTDLAVHELSHLAGGLAVSAVVVEKVGDLYCMTDRSHSGFTDIRDNIAAPTIGEGESDYSGSALDESWAALNSSRFLLELQGYQIEELSIHDRYTICATTQSTNGEDEFSAVSGLHSWKAGAVIENLDATYPGILATMTAVADGTMELSDATDKFRVTLPAEVITLLNQPRFSAWQELYGRFAQTSQY